MINTKIFLHQKINYLEIGRLVLLSLSVKYLNANVCEIGFTIEVCKILQLKVGLSFLIRTKTAQCPCKEGLHRQKIGSGQL